MDQVHATISDLTVDNHYMTREFLEKSLVDNLARIKELDELVNSTHSRYSMIKRNHDTMRDAMQHWTLGELDRDSITEDQASEIAEICGFELTKEVEVEVTVTYNLTVNLPYYSDVESIVSDIDFDTVSYNDENISYMSSSVDRIDF